MRLLDTWSRYARYHAYVGSDALYREAMHLSEEERATLAVRLLASVDEPAVDDSEETYTAWLREIEHRLDALVSGEDPGEDWDAVQKELVAEYTAE
jgi:hypothetical protein